MIQICKEEPNFFIEKRRKVKNHKQSNAWAEISDIRTKLRYFILKTEQQSMCVYCEKGISSDAKKSNIDHFKTRKTHPELTLEYENLLVSCNNHLHCSNKKDNYGLKKDDFKEIINPALDEIKESFTYTTFGELVATNNKAKFAIKVFGLNSTALIQERKNIILHLDSYKSLSANDIFNILGSHKTLIEFIKEDNYSK